MLVYTSSVVLVSIPDLSSSVYITSSMSRAILKVIRTGLVGSGTKTTVVCELIVLFTCRQKGSSKAYPFVG